MGTRSAINTILDPRAQARLRVVTSALGLDVDRLPQRYTLGTINLRRYLAGRDGERQENLDRAVEAFVPFRLAAVDVVPEVLLPLVDEAARPLAETLLDWGTTGEDPNETLSATALWALFRQNGRHGPADETADGPELFTASVTAPDAPVPGSDEAPVGDTGSVLWLNTRSNRHFDRFELTGSDRHLDKALELARASLRYAPVGHELRPVVLSNLSVLLFSRYQRSRLRSELDEAIQHRGETADTAPSANTGWLEDNSALIVLLIERFRAYRDEADLDEAVTVGQRAVRAGSQEDPYWSKCQHNLAYALATRAQRTGNREDADLAVAAAQRAYETTSGDDTASIRRLVALAEAYRTRYELFRDTADLDLAVAHAEAAMDAVSPDSPDFPGCLSLLGTVLRVRGERTADVRQLMASAHLFSALESVGRDTTWISGAPFEAATTLLALYQLTGRPDCLFGAVRALRRALSISTARHPDRAEFRSALARALRLVYEANGDRAALEEALKNAESTIFATPPDHPLRAVYLSVLAEIQHTRFRATSDLTDRERACDSYATASQVPTAAPSLRIRSARAAAALLRTTDPGRAADLAASAVRLLAGVAPRQLRRVDQQHELAGLTDDHGLLGTAGQAAELVLADPRGTGEQRASRALGLLESGRAILLSQGLEARDDLTEVRRLAPALAERFSRLRDRLDRPGPARPLAVPTAAGAADGSLPWDHGEGADDRHRVAADFEDTLVRIRALDGMARFGLPPEPDVLVAEACHGAIVVLNVGLLRADAILVTPAGVAHLPLPGLEVSDLIDAAECFTEAVHTIATATGREHRRRRRWAQQNMTEVLEWLWDTVTGPVLEELGHRSQPGPDADWPRVWWIPTGFLNLLPLHAAGHHTDPSDAPGRRTVMDRVVSSYTPTIRALRHSRERLAAQTPVAAGTAPCGFVAAMPTTPGLPDGGRLRHIPQEVAALREQVPDLDVLIGSDAPAGAGERPPVKADVLARLASCRIAHFACHGTSDLADPSQSRLLLHDHAEDPLTVAGLAPVRLDGAQLAYLSACRTAWTGDLRLTDESIHLAAAFQLAGFPHVIGTFWEIDDEVSARVAESFYVQLRNAAGTIDPNRAALALHHAVRDVRDGRDLGHGQDRVRSPYLWAAHLHTGP
ncbi:CHAT domain-containing protein [Streptomyces sp. NPDC015220]|uniref:CHAT domain-containing tetratricopeptide repeat protein n=1 Tax=Streptomyces sp. NPDC015220 TaxID=3364947 RepID=UPI00370256B2